MDSLELIRKLHSALPAVREWIDNLLEQHRAQAISIITLGFPGIQKAFPADLLQKARVVALTGSPPFPPLSRMGLPEFAQMENMPMAGITYKDTFFINRSYQQTESLHFHELVHVVQWERLGVDDFLMAYGAGLMQFGYKDSPLEQMAYSLQQGFDRGGLPPNIVDLIRQQTEAIWTGIAPLISKA